MTTAGLKLVKLFNSRKKSADAEHALPDTSRASFDAKEKYKNWEWSKKLGTLLRIKLADKAILDEPLAAFDQSIRGVS